jgi:hypothetical protein
MSAGRLVLGVCKSLGLRIAWSSPPVVAELLETMLGGDMASENPVSPSDELSLDFTDTEERLPYEPPSGFEWSFYQDRVVAYAGRAAFSFQDDASEVRVPLGPGAIVGRFHPSSFEDPRSLRLMLDLALAMALRARGLFHLHAAGAVRGESCVLLPGESGAGKTSSTLALVDAGWSYLSDDSVFLRAQDGKHPTVLAQRREFHLTPATLGAYPSLGSLAAPSRAEVAKMHLAPEQAFPGRFREAAPAPALLLFPAVVAAETSSAAPISHATAFGHLLMASALLSVPGTPNAQMHLDLLKDLVGGAACFELRLGADFLRSPAQAVAAVVEPLVGGGPTCK